jgi:hypothetical protein
MRRRRDKDTFEVIGDVRRDNRDVSGKQVVTYSH